MGEVKEWMIHMSHVNHMLRHSDPQFIQLLKVTFWSEIDRVKDKSKNPLLFLLLTIIRIKVINKVTFLSN